MSNENINWFDKVLLFFKKYKAVWGFIIWTLSLLYIIFNYSDFVADSNYIDILIIAVFAILTLMPLISEISLFGISIKKELNGFKNDIDEKLINLRNDIISVKLNNNISPNFYNMYPVSDTQQLESEMEKLKRTSKYKPSSGINLSISEDTIFFFKARYELEIKLRKIYYILFARSNYKILNFKEILSHSLFESFVMKKNYPIDISKSTREIYNICSRAIHGEKHNEEQENYVRFILPALFDFYDEFYKYILEEEIVY